MSQNLQTLYNVVLCNISKCIDNQQANDIYHAYVYPHITYGLELYGLTYKKNTKKLQVAQNQIIKVLHKKEQMFCTKELYSETKLLNINQLNELLILNFVYKQRNHLLPKVFENYYVTHKDIKTKDIKTRQDNKLFINTKYKTDSAKLNIKFYGVKFWNNLPQNIKKYKWLNFKKNCKIYLLNKQQNN